jgi:hypothetical protein
MTTTMMMKFMKRQMGIYGTTVHLNDMRKLASSFSVFRARAQSNSDKIQNENRCASLVRSGCIAVFWARSYLFTEPG